MYRILLAEDDFNLADEMRRQLSAYGNEVVLIRDFRAVTEEFIACKPDLVLLDILLPFKDGYFWCGEIRKISSVPIVFISSASDNMNIVMAMNMGGDDFIPKPVDGMVLCAKVGAILRRTYELNGDRTEYDFHGAMLNPNDSTVLYNEKVIDLTKNECRILQTLLENKGKIVSRDTLMTRLWQSDLYVEENTLTVNISRLRKKLEENGLCGVIATKPGSGYILT